MTFIIGICGGSGAGKTTLANKIKEYFNDELTIINYDSYCLGAPELPEGQKHLKNYDEPSAYDAALFAKHVKMLKKGEAIDRPDFDFATHSRLKTTTRIEPKKIIILEGILVFQVKEAVDSFDLKIYVDASESRRLERRTRRDIIERGRTKESVYNQFYKTVLPMHNIYVEPTKEISDYIFDNENDNGLDIDQVDYIIRIIQEHI